MNYTIYNPVTGQITELYSTSDSAEQSLVLTNSCHVQGFYDPNLYYIEQGQPHLKPTKPDGLYLFNYTTKCWEIDLDQLIVHIRQQRNLFLNAVDRVNPVWYDSLSEQQQQELKTYRQALLDVPQQAGFPTAIEWPAKPAWL